MGFWHPVLWKFLMGIFCCIVKLVCRGIAWSNVVSVVFEAKTVLRVEYPDTVVQNIIRIFFYPNI